MSEFGILSIGPNAFYVTSSAAKLLETLDGYSMSTDDDGGLYMLCRHPTTKEYDYWNVTELLLALDKLEVVEKEPNDGNNVVSITRKKKAPAEGPFKETNNE